MKPENTGKKQGGRFQKGISGNKLGRPKGALNNTTIAVKNLFENEAEQIGRKAIELALTGDMQAIKLIIERIVPVKKESSVSIDMPKIKTTENIMQALEQIIDGVASGNITPAEGQTIISMIEHSRKFIETNDLEQRITRLESQHD